VHATHCSSPLGGRGTGAAGAGSGSRCNPRKVYWQEGRDVMAIIKDEDFTDEVAACLEVTMEICKVLRLCDSDQPVIGKIYIRMMNLYQNNSILMQTFDQDDFNRVVFPKSRVLQIQEICKGRHDYMHCDYHAAAYALDPEYIDVDVDKCDKEVYAGLKRVIGRLYHGYDSDEEKKQLYKDAIKEFREYNGPDSKLKTTECKIIAEDCDAHEFWQSEGRCYPALRYVAMRVLSKPLGIGSVERSHKKLKNVILTAKRNRLHISKVNQELYINYNTAFLCARIKAKCADDKLEKYYMADFTLDEDDEEVRRERDENEETDNAVDAVIDNDSD
jgi:hypothetical protein